MIDLDRSRKIINENANAAEDAALVAGKELIRVRKELCPKWNPGTRQPYSLAGWDKVKEFEDTLDIGTNYIRKLISHVNGGKCLSNSRKVNSSKMSFYSWLTPIPKKRRDSILARVKEEQTADLLRELADELDKAKEYQAWLDGKSEHINSARAEFIGMAA